ncbi:MAG: multicopper oxidase family protein [Bacteriovoracaceae bacterium]|nr:multicopper oxidase family protein [Bacteriovoracaceae bacterium]
MVSFSRRDFLGKGIGCIGASLAVSNSWARATTSVFLNDPDIIIELTAKEVTRNIDPNTSAKFWSYVGKVIRGPKETLGPSNGSYLGPTIEVKTGDRVKIIFKNSLPEKSIIHWHGLDVDHKNDGHPSLAINPNGEYVYDFVVENRAGMYWYHPHPHGRTGFQVYQGLAGLFIVRDRVEESLNLPNKEQELRFVVQDRFFNDQGELEYRPSMMGAFGDKLLINGKLERKIKVKKGLYRIRLLNGCNARVFNLALSHGEEIKQIGSDGGLLEKTNKLTNFFFAPAERVDIVVDFSAYSEGEVITLEGLPLVEGRGKKYSVVEFEVTNEVGQSFSEPTGLAAYKRILPQEATNFSNPKVFELVPKRGLGWTINGHGYEPNAFEDNEIIKFGDTEVWEFYNPTGMPHPMHIHGTQFQVLKRLPGQLTGCLDSGWKDTILVMPGDRVQVLKRFNTYKGIFLYHCHNLEHEDMSMMRNFKII